jgi:hypothetical protein
MGCSDFSDCLIGRGVIIANLSNSEPIHMGHSSGGREDLLDFLTIRGGIASVVGTKVDDK